MASSNSLGSPQPTLAVDLAATHSSGLQSGLSASGSPLGSPAKAASLPRRGPQYRILKRQTQVVSGKLAEFMKAYDLLPDIKDRMDAISDRIYEEDKRKADMMGRIEKEIESHELAVVQAALKESNKIAVDQMEVYTLRNLNNERDQEKEQDKQKMAQEIAMKVADQARFQELEFASTFAEAQATENAIEAERRALHEEIKSLRNEIASQKKLSSDIVRAK